MKRSGGFKNRRVFQHLAEKQSRRRIKSKNKRRRRGPDAFRKSHFFESNSDHEATLKDAVVAYPDMRLFHNTDKCLEIIKKIRYSGNYSRIKSIRFLSLDLTQVTSIDFGLISVLTALSDELRDKRVVLRVTLPDDLDCRKYMIESGYLSNLYQEDGKKFKVFSKSEMVFFEKGKKRFSVEDQKQIKQVLSHVSEHLGDEPCSCKSIKTIIKEVCGNAIEWSGTINQRWNLGVKYEKDHIIFTITDVGQGILETLYIQHGTLLEQIKGKTRAEILMGAFEKKYGSSTRQINRNKGLPAVKFRFDWGHISNLKVLTNDVLLSFDDDNLTRIIPKKIRFKGTLYQWKMDASCINEINNKNYEYTQYC